MREQTSPDISNAKVSNPVELTVKPANPIPTVNLSGIDALKQNLISQINGIADVAVRDKLLTRINEDNDLLRTGSPEALRNPVSPEDAKNKPTLGNDKSTSLKDRHDKTATIIKNATNEAAIADALMDLQKAQQALFDAKTTKEKQDPIDAALTDLFVYFNKPTLQSTVARFPGSGTTASGLLSYIKSLQPPILYDSDNKRYIHFSDDNTVTSEDPVALGLAIAGSGYQSVTLSGRPWNVLITAKHALARGVETIEFDDMTKKLLLDPTNPIYSLPECPYRYVWVKREYEAIQNQMRAIQTAKNRPNSVFDKDALSTTAQEFLELNTHAPGQFEKLELMLPEKQAALAEEVKSKTFVRHNVPLNGLEFIRSLLKNGEPDALENFEAAFRTLERNKYGPNLVNQAPKDVPDYIFKNFNTKESRGDMYEQLGKSAALNDDTKNEIRAAILAKIMDSNLAAANQSAAQTAQSRMQSPFGAIAQLITSSKIAPTDLYPVPDNILKNHKEEVDTLLSTIPDQKDRDAVMAKFDDQYCRVTARLAAEAKRKATKVESTVDLSFNYPEEMFDPSVAEANNNDSLLLNKQTLFRYAALKSEVRKSSQLVGQGPSAKTSSNTPSASSSDETDSSSEEVELDEESASEVELDDGIDHNSGSDSPKPTK